jgi:signal peptidase I
MVNAPSRKRLLIWVIVSIVVIIFGILFFLRSFVVAAYNVPTRAMEKTIHVGDRILVTKLNYLPISRGDILIFHFPVGDTVINLDDYQSMMPYYDVIRRLGNGNGDSGRQIILGNPDRYPLVIRPISKRETYLKRCIALPGDTLEIRDEVPFIDGRQHSWPSNAQTYFRVVTNGRFPDEEEMQAKYGVNLTNTEEVHALDSPHHYLMLLTWKASEKMAKDGIASQITPVIESSTEGIFPGDGSHHWTTDNYGPLWVPKKGGRAKLTSLTFPIYERIIRTYEGNKLEMRNGKIYINDHEENSYTFKMNYYWVIGDNLHESQDSRYWGFVPEDHLIGKVKATM